MVRHRITDDQWECIAGVFPPPQATTFRKFARGRPVDFGGGNNGKPLHSILQKNL